MGKNHTTGPWEAQSVQMEEHNIIGPYVNIYAHGIMYPSCPAIVGGADADEALANARLIAAAPDLLGACRGLVVCNERYELGEHADDEAALIRAKVAIAKATDQSEEGSTQCQDTN